MSTSCILASFNRRPAKGKVKADQIFQQQIVQHFQGSDAYIIRTYVLFVKCYVYFFYLLFLIYFFHLFPSTSFVAKNKPEQNGIPIPFCSGLSRIADSSCPSVYPYLFNYYFSTTLFYNNTFAVFTIKCCNHFSHCVNIKIFSATLY